MVSAPSLSFAAPAIADAPRVRELTRHAMSSDLAFANIYLLQEKYGTTIALAGGFLFRHFSGGGRLAGYAFPCGEGDIAAALELTRRDAAARRRIWEFCLLTQEQRLLLEQLYPGEFAYHSDRGDADYLYTREQLLSLPGTAFHAKRNHIAQFERAHPDWRFEPLGRDNERHALHIAEEWLRSLPQPTPALQHELRAIAKALHHSAELQLTGGIIYADARPIAMSISSAISPSVADIHYEKCLPEWKKAYPLINRESARFLSGYNFINREEDLNQPGLRQAKLSYHPSLILEKFTATPSRPC